jgi:hypothetical protein
MSLLNKNDIFNLSQNITSLFLFFSYIKKINKRKKITQLENDQRSFIIYLGLGLIKGFTESIRINKLCNFLSNDIFSITYYVCTSRLFCAYKISDKVITFYFYMFKSNIFSLTYYFDYKLY